MYLKTCIRTVSYTHLDVYKRQPRTNWQMMAVDGTAKTSGFVENIGPRRNSRGRNFNNIDSGRVVKPAKHIFKVTFGFPPRNNTHTQQLKQ